MIKDSILSGPRIFLGTVHSHLIPVCVGIFWCLPRVPNSRCHWKMVWDEKFRDLWRNSILTEICGLPNSWFRQRWRQIARARPTGERIEEWVGLPHVTRRCRGGSDAQETPCPRGSLHLKSQSETEPNFRSLMTFLSFLFKLWSFHSKSSYINTLISHRFVETFCKLVNFCSLFSDVSGKSDFQRIQVSQISSEISVDVLGIFNAWKFERAVSWFGYIWLHVLIYDSSK